MQVIINKKEGKLMDFLACLNYSNVEEIKAELSPDEKELFKETFEDISAIGKLLEKYDLEKHLFTRNASSYMQRAYVQLLKNGKNPSSISQIFSELKKLSLAEKRTILIDMLTDEDIDPQNFDLFFKIIDKELDNQKDKWKCLWIYQNIDQNLEELEKIYDDFLPLYETFYKKYEEEVDKMVDTFDIFKYFEDSPIDLNQIISSMKIERIIIFVGSSLHPNMTLNSRSDGTLEAYVYPMSLKILEKRKSFDTDMINMAVKALSDPIRYDILKEVTSSNLMNKQIAEKLKITPANVSFHIQKLINANLLRISMEDSGVKYDVNEEMIRSLINMLESDFL